MQPYVGHQLRPAVNHLVLRQDHQRFRVLPDKIDGAAQLAAEVAVRPPGCKLSRAYMTAVAPGMSGP